MGLALLPLFIGPQEGPSEVLYAQSFSEKLQSFKSLKAVSRTCLIYSVYSFASDVVDTFGTLSSFALDWSALANLTMLVTYAVFLSDTKVYLASYLSSMVCSHISILFVLTAYAVEFSQSRPFFEQKRWYFLLFCVCAEISLLLTYFRSMHLFPNVLLPFYRQIKLTMTLSWFAPFIYLSGLWTLLRPSSWTSMSSLYKSIDTSMLYLFGIIACLGISAVVIVYPSLSVSNDTEEEVFINLALLDISGLFLARQFRGFVGNKMKEQLIQSFLPKKLYNRLMNKAHAARWAREYAPSQLLVPETKECCVIFIDLVKSMDIARGCGSSAEYKAFLHEFFQVIDGCAEAHGVIKIETIGDCHLAVCGLLDDEGDNDFRPEFARRTALFTLAVLEGIKTLRTKSGEPVSVRVGMDLGEISHSITPGNSARWAIYGDSVNRASRMQSSSLPGKIQCSPEFATHLDVSKGGFALEPRGEIDIKGVGLVCPYWLVSTS